MTEPSNEKIELLVRSVLAAVDARLAEIRGEIQAVVTDVERRHRDVLTHIQDLEHRWESGGEPRHMTSGADPISARIEMTTQVLLERIEVLHQRNTLAANERFAEINHRLDRLASEAYAPATAAISMASLDGMNAPLRVGAPTGEVPIATHVPASPPLPFVAPPKITTTTPTITTSTSAQPISEHVHDGEHDGEPIDMERLTDLLSAHLGQISLPTQHG